MFAMICTDNLRYKKTKYYDSEYVIKGTLHINEHAYAFSHYEGAFEVLGIRWLSNYTKGRYRGRAAFAGTQGRSNRVYPANRTRV